ncbi:hypothetical protein LJC19_04750 [Oxalobacter sp. OttesenSCG-928-P03]|nr:hypothetical protein [Oxalobacter sp. OttesenSCG-928-P03]
MFFIEAKEVNQAEADTLYQNEVLNKVDLGLVNILMLSKDQIMINTADGRTALIKIAI